MSSSYSIAPPTTAGSTDYDLIIVGAGMIGGSLACALRGTGLRIALVEAIAPRAASQPSYDERVLALSWGSRRILEACGLWAGLMSDAAPITRVHISERGQFGFSHLERETLGVDALGFVVPARSLGEAISTALAECPDVTVLCPARVTGQRVEGDIIEAQVSMGVGQQTLRARLLVAADGGDSAIRRGLGIDTEERSYGQDAVITTVTPDRPTPGTAYERFTDSGPLALLPMTDGRYSVVWTCLDTETTEILALDDDAFLARLQARFGYRMGRLGRPAPRRAYPLRLSLAQESVLPRLVLIGNAAHTLHPVAGQGFNLGLRDVAALAEVVADAARRLEDPGAAEVLADYGRWRGRDQKTVAQITDGLARLFVNPWLPLRLARGAGMIGLDLLPGARSLVARRFMGRVGRLPRLARGLSLVGPTSPGPAITAGHGAGRIGDPGDPSAPPTAA